MTNSSERGLFSSEFEHYFKNIPIIKQHFGGVKAIDQLPRSIPIRNFLIVNLSPSSHPGSHWITLFRSHSQTLELFNSLGSENIANIKPYFKFNFKTTLTYNNTGVQLPTTSTCGLYCIYFAVHRLLNLDQNFEEIMDEIFSANLNTNENKVAEFCTHLLKLRSEDDLFDF